MTIRSAVIDACVLFSANIRDTLLRTAEFGIFQPLWSDEILNEFTRNLIKTKKADETKVQKLKKAMKEAFPEAMANPSDQLITEMLNEIKDRHVLATAVSVSCKTIITFNLKDFPENSLLPYQVKALSPDTFLYELVIQYPDEMRQIVTLQANSLKKNPKTYEQMLDSLATLVPNFISELKKFS